MSDKQKDNPNLEVSISNDVLLNTEQRDGENDERGQNGQDDPLFITD